MKQVLFFVLVVLCSFSVEAVRVNSNGKKLVKHIKEEWVDWNGDRAYNLCHEYNFTYDTEGNLKSVSKSSEDKPHKYLEKLEFVDNNFKFTVLQDGKPIKNHNCEYIWDKSSKKPNIPKIKGCLIKSHEKDEDGLNHYFASFQYYTQTYALRMECIGYDTFNEWTDYIKDDQYYSMWSATDMNPHNHLYLIPKEVFNKFGFKDGMHFYMSSDSIMYMVDNYEMKEFAYMNGNAVDRPRGELSEYKDPCKYKIEYTSYDNDTNINFLHLSHSLLLNSFYSNIECITEWFPIQSKKLPSYEERWGNSFSKKWDYKFDEDGNLVEITMIDRTYGGKCTVTYTITYVSD